MTTTAPRLDRDHPDDDPEIIRRIRSGETALFEVLMRRHNEMVYRAVRSRLRDETEIEEVMQKSYLLAFSKIDQFEGRSKFSTWLVRIALNVASTQRARVRVVHEPISELLPGGVDPEDRVASKELVSLVEDEADQLSDNLRSVFVLCDVEGLTASETAACLGLTEEAVRVRLHRARKQLRAGLLERIGEVEQTLFRFYAPRCNRVVAFVMERLPPLS